MGEIGLGLLNRELLKKVKERWRIGDVAVLVLQLALPESDARRSLARWEKEQKHLFWRQKLGADYVYFLSCSAKKSDIKSLVRKAIQSLDALVASALQQAEQTLGSESGYDDSLRFGIAYAGQDPRQSAEALVLQGLIRAMEHKARNHVQAGAAAEMEWEIPPTLESNATAPRPRQSDWGRTSLGAFPIGKLTAPIRQLPDQAPVSVAANLFEADPESFGVVILKENKPVGLLMREKLYQLLAGQYGMSLYWNRPVERIMDYQPLIVDEHMPVEQVSQLAMARNFSRLYDIVIITSGGQMIGATSIRDLLECMTTLRTEEARTANPLTGLPGNEGIQFEIQRRIAAGKPIAIVYADLDYFKWFNDYLGFSQGDELLRFVAGLMVTAFRGGSDPNAFVGHIGGDDFIAILDPGQAEEACRYLIERFDKEVLPFYGENEMKSVEDRHGNRIDQQGVTLSLSLMIWNGKAPISPSDISRAAAKLKKKAKAVRGSSCVMEMLDNSQPLRNEGHT